MDVMERRYAWWLDHKSFQSEVQSNAAAQVRPGAPKRKTQARTAPVFAGPSDHTEKLGCRAVRAQITPIIEATSGWRTMSRSARRTTAISSMASRRAEISARPEMPGS